MTIEKIDAGSSNAIIRQLWLGDSIEELDTAANKFINQYPIPGYGTMVSKPQPCATLPQVKHYAGKFFCSVSRYTSCD